VKGFKPEHIVALHAFRDKVVDAMSQFYTAVGADKADPVLDHYFTDPPDLPAQIKRAVAKKAAAEGRK